MGSECSCFLSDSAWCPADLSQDHYIGRCRGRWLRVVIGMAAGGAATPLPVTGVQVAYVDEAGAERRGALDVV